MPPPLLLLLSIFAMAALNLLLPLARFSPSWLGWLGVVPLAIGAVINLQADRAFHRANTPVKPWLPSTALITGGPFTWTRNPMYLGFILILTGIWAMLGSVSPALVVVAFAIVMDRIFVPPEEKKMQQTFGDAFEAYRRRVRRWV
jgi:protein-S-isoprenylcysteine O-methyltransferase Ste14